MEAEINKNYFWNEAGKAGLILGSISAVYMFMTQLLTVVGMNAILSSTLSLVLWGAKFAGCIWTMMFMMNKYCKNTPNINNNISFRFGAASAFLSALVFSAVSFANVAYFSADLYAEQMEIVMQTYAKFMDSNMMAQMGKWMDRLPQLTFFSNLIYCTFYGTILSFILSRNIPSRDPFADYKPEEKE